VVHINVIATDISNEIRVLWTNLRIDWRPVLVLTRAKLGWEKRRSLKAKSGDVKCMKVKTSSMTHVETGIQAHVERVAGLKDDLATLLVELV
jgi:hypothetical protein